MAGDRLPDNFNEPSPAAVRQHLQAILDSQPFATATRARRFLTYVVEQTLAGRADGIKELVLGVEVCDRTADFDPKIDTIVRVEAGKLRKRLEDYYASAGSTATLRIEVPKGSYVPRFLPQVQPATPAAGVEPAYNSGARRYAAGSAVLLLTAACAWWAIIHFRDPAPRAIPSIVVLPFLNLSPDPGNEYFADGLTEQLTDGLCNAGGLRVAARTSAFSFKGKAADVKEIAARLHVEYLVEGSVRRQGDQLKVTAQLIRTDDGYHLWSRSFDRKLSDVFAVQQELTESLVAALQVKLTTGQTRRLKKNHTASREAFDLYLQGKHFASTFAPGDLDKAEAFFQQSINADPAYALAYAGLASTLLQANIVGNRPARELASKARVAIRRALELDDELPDAYVIQGVIAARHEFNWQAADRNFRHALELNPSSAMAHYNLAQAVYGPQGRWAEALAESRLASELDPLSPMIAMSEPWLALLEGRNQAAVDGFGRLAAANSFDTMALGGLAFAFMQIGDYQAALKANLKVQEMQPSPQSLAFLGWTYARMGKPAEARKILDQLLAQSKRGEFIGPGTFCALYAGLGDADGVFRYLEKAREQQESFLIYARTQLLWEPFRNDPRFFKLLTEIGLSDEQVQKNQAGTPGSHG